MDYLLIALLLNSHCLVFHNWLFLDLRVFSVSHSQSAICDNDDPFRYNQSSVSASSVQRGAGEAVALVIHLMGASKLTKQTFLLGNTFINENLQNLSIWPRASTSTKGIQIDLVTVFCSTTLFKVAGLSKLN